ADDNHGPGDRPKRTEPPVRHVPPAEPVCGFPARSPADQIVAAVRPVATHRVLGTPFLPGSRRASYGVPGEDRHHPDLSVTRRGPRGGGPPIATRATSRRRV